MTKLPKFFLTISLACFAVGAVVCLANIGVHPSWMVSMPAGAIFFGLFLNAYILQGEVAKFDEETQMRIRMAENFALNNEANIKQEVHSTLLVHACNSNLKAAA